MTARFNSRAAFCACLARGLRPRQAARAVGITRATAYRWKADDPEFAAMWADALEERTEEAEAQLFRAVQDGQPWAVMYALRHWKPAIYNRKTITVAGDMDNPLVVAQAGIADNVHFYMPSNGRDQPEVLDESITIEGDATEAA